MCNAIRKGFALVCDCGLRGQEHTPVNHRAVMKSLLEFVQTTHNTKIGVVFPLTATGP